MSMAPQDLVFQLAEMLRTHGAMLACAESCTGGLIAGACTDVSGSSDWFERGIVSYSNLAKQQLLGVPEELLVRHGAVSEPVARAMATGLLIRAPVTITLAVTGVAGPTGGSKEKPVGLVWLAWAWRDASGRVQVDAQARQFDGDRAAVRRATVLAALQGVLERVTFWPPAGSAMGKADPGSTA